MNESVVFEDFILLFGIESQMNVTLDCRVSKLRWIQGKHSALLDDKFTKITSIFSFEFMNLNCTTENCNFPCATFLTGLERITEKM
jgi:hypothetical protein